MGITAHGNDSGFNSRISSSIIEPLNGSNSEQLVLPAVRLYYLCSAYEAESLEQGRTSSTGQLTTSQGSYRDPRCKGPSQPRHYSWFIHAHLFRLLARSLSKAEPLAVICVCELAHAIQCHLTYSPPRSTPAKQSPLDLRIQARPVVACNSLRPLHHGIYISLLIFSHRTDSSLTQSSSSLDLSSATFFFFLLGNDPDRGSK